MNPRILQKD